MWQNVFPVFLKPCVFSFPPQVSPSSLLSSPRVCRMIYISPDASLDVLRLLPTAPKAVSLSPKQQTGVGLSPHTGIKESFTLDKQESQLQVRATVNPCCYLK